MGSVKIGWGRFSRITRITRIQYRGMIRCGVVEYNNSYKGMMGCFLMIKKYKLDPVARGHGRSLQSNLTVRNYDIFKEDEIQKKGSCSFSYLDAAHIVVDYSDNTVVIEADDIGSLRAAESKLKEICDEKSIPLVDVDVPKDKKVVGTGLSTGDGMVDWGF